MNTDSKDKNANIDLTENSLTENSVEEINSSEKYCSENSDNTNNEKGCCHKTKERTTDEQKKLMNREQFVELRVRLEELKVWLKKMLTVQIFLYRFLP